MMPELQEKYNTIGEKYRKIFYSTVEEISSLIESLKPAEVAGDICDFYERGSAGYGWQEAVKAELDKKLKEKLSEEVFQTRKIRENYHCIGCGVCCKFAVSEFSPQELKYKAQNGDKFARQFMSVFIPYETREDAAKVYPEYIDFLNKNTDGHYYIYHCPKVTEDNRCPDYENRPQICRDFPDNPLGFLPKPCGYTGWKLKTENLTLQSSILFEVINFYLNHIPVSGFLD